MARRLKLEWVTPGVDDAMKAADASSWQAFEAPGNYCPECGLGPCSDGCLPPFTD